MYMCLFRNMYKSRSVKELFFDKELRSLVQQISILMITIHKGSVMTIHVNVAIFVMGLFDWLLRFHLLSHLLQFSDFAFEEHIVLWRESNACSENILDTGALFEQGVDNWCIFWNEWCFQQVAENRQNCMEGLEFLFGTNLHLDSLAQFGEEDQVENDRGCQQRIFARVMQHDCVGAVHHNFRGVFVHSSFRVSHIRDILDDDHVIEMLSLFVQHSVGVDHIIHDIALRDLLGAELLGGRQVFAVVVAKVVVADD